MPTGSPGDGITPALLSKEPLATEGEATPGPDDENPYAALEDKRQREGFAQEMATFDEPQATMPDFDEPESTPLLFKDFDFPNLW